MSSGAFISLMFKNNGNCLMACFPDFLNRPEESSSVKWKKERKKNDRSVCALPDTSSFPSLSPLTFLQLLPRGLWLTAPNEGVKNTSAILVKICTNSPGKNITKNKWCDHLLLTLFARPYSIRYCLLFWSKLSWVKTGLFPTVLLFVWKMYLLGPLEHPNWWEALGQQV